MMRAITFSLLLSLWAASAAHAVSIASTTDITPSGMTGVKVQKLRLASPATDAYVVRVDLCAAGVRVDATAPSTSARTVGSWAQSAGAAVAVNADFFKTGPLRVYGQAVGAGRAWPAVNTGTDPAYAGEWFYQRFGWLAVGDGFVEHNHTKHVKSRRATYDVEEGFAADVVTNEFPPRTRALVSGFPELVHEGHAHTCADGTATACFPDRSDMADRHPRTAIGITEDRRTLLLVVVDGRTSRNAGLRGLELARLMELAGAWWALNLDGGGSSELWVDGAYKNDTTGNNHGGATRAVANHLGVFLDGSSAPPAHCQEQTMAAAFGPGQRAGSTTSDIDGDGAPDACRRDPTGLVCALGATGTELSFPLFSDDAGWSDLSNAATLRMGDIDGDGRADVCARADAGVACWTSASGPFSTRIEGPAFADDSGWSRERYFTTLRLADIDGDGLDDLCARAAAGLLCARSTGEGFLPPVQSGRFTNDEAFDLPRHYGTLRMGDVDGDGRADACARAVDGVRCFFGPDFVRGVTGPAWSDAAGFAKIRHWGTFQLDDVDDDGRADVCVRTAAEFRCHLSVATADTPDGEAGFGAVVHGPAWSDDGEAERDNTATLRLGDVDGDGDLDACSRDDAGLACARFERASGAFAAVATVATAPLLDNASGWTAPRRYESLRLVDVTGDGRADLCTRDADGFGCAPSTTTPDGPVTFGPRVVGPAWSGVPGEVLPVWSTLLLVPSQRPLPPPPGEGEGEGAGEGAGAGEGVPAEGEGDGAPIDGGGVPSDGGGVPSDGAGAEGVDGIAAGDAERAPLPVSVSGGCASSSASSSTSSGASVGALLPLFGFVGVLGRRRGRRG